MNDVEQIITNRLKLAHLTVSDINKPRYRRQRDDIISAVIGYSTIFSDHKVKYVRRVIRAYGIKFSDEQFRELYQESKQSINKVYDTYTPAKLRLDHVPNRRT